MLEKLSYHTAALPEGDVPPEWLHLLPPGTFYGQVDGRGPFHNRSMSDVIEASIKGGCRLPVDENHSTQKAAAAGLPSPARAWIVELEARHDGIWGRTEWTDEGADLYRKKAYKALSPVHGYKPDGTVTRLVSVALTNNPNLTQLTALHTPDNQTGADMDITVLRTALGLSETASEADVLAAVKKNNEMVAAHTATIEKLSTTHVPMVEHLALHTRVEKMEKDGKQERAVAFVDGAIGKGKALQPVRDKMIAMHVADPEGTEALINGLVDVNAGGTEGRAEHAAGADGVSDADMAIYGKMGITDRAKVAEAIKANKKGA
jgi:phage I-like protein